MSDIAIKIENLSKQYRLGVVGTQTLRGDLQRFWWRLTGKGDPTLKIGEENKLDIAEGEYVWALRDINLEIKKGEILGIIGKNGAGKSTLLKILSRVTGPTTGSVKINGRLASLLEVGTGFHPELTGRENIFLNGAILGMTKQEIKSKLDEIVEFAGIAKYLDTPVKRYSSGMYVRLGFAVAAHLNSEILVVDEVLAVGDAEFQKKAIGKMQDVSKGQGRTVLFVSHNMGSIKALCKSGIVLKNGNISYEGTSAGAIENYLSQYSIKENKGKIDYRNENIGDEQVNLLEVSVFDKLNKIKTVFSPDEEIFMKIKFNVKSQISGMRFNLAVKTTSGITAFATSSHNITKNRIEKGEHCLYLKIPANLLNKNRYILSLNAGIPGYKYIFKPIECMYIDIDGATTHGSIFTENWPGVVAPKIDWKLK